MKKISILNKRIFLVGISWKYDLLTLINLTLNKGKTLNIMIKIQQTAQGFMNKIHKSKFITKNE
jgi:hypothetical protein